MDQGDWHERITQYLLVQHIILHASTGQSPAELLMGCGLRSPLDRLQLDFVMLETSDSFGQPRSSLPGDRVYTRNYAGETVGPSSCSGHLWPLVLPGGSGGQSDLALAYQPVAAPGQEPVPIERGSSSQP